MEKKLSNIVLWYDSYLEYVSRVGKELTKIEKGYMEYIHNNDLKSFFEEYDLDGIVQRILNDLLTYPELWNYFDYSEEEKQLLIHTINFDMSNEGYQKIFDKIIIENTEIKNSDDEENVDGYTNRYNVIEFNDSDDFEVSVSDYEGNHLYDILFTYISFGNCELIRVTDYEGNKIADEIDVEIISDCRKEIQNYIEENDWITRDYDKMSDEEILRDYDKFVGWSNEFLGDSQSEEINWSNFSRKKYDKLYQSVYSLNKSIQCVDFLDIIMIINNI